MEEPSITQNILAVFPPGEDRAILAEIFSGSRWKLHAAGTLAEARRAIPSITAVISESRLPDGHWTDLLCGMQEMTDPPPLIVADRLADEGLWAEVLNLGGHDLLAKPFDAKEVLYAADMAYRSWKNRQQMIAPRQRSRRAEKCSVYTAKTRTACGGRH